jgi:hypothetical protein
MEGGEEADFCVLGVVAASSPKSVILFSSLSLANTRPISLKDLRTPDKPSAMPRFTD